MKKEVPEKRFYMPFRNFLNEKIHLGIRANQHYILRDPMKFSPSQTYTINLKHKKHQDRYAYLVYLFAKDVPSKLPFALVETIVTGKFKPSVEWFIHLINGGKLTELASFPFFVNPAIERQFYKLRETYAFSMLIRKAQVLGLGGNQSTFVLLWPYLRNAPVNPTYEQHFCDIIGYLAKHNIKRANRIHPIVKYFMTLVMEEFQPYARLNMSVGKRIFTGIDHDFHIFSYKPNELYKRSHQLSSFLDKDFFDPYELAKLMKDHGLNNLLHAYQAFIKDKEGVIPTFESCLEEFSIFLIQKGKTFFHPVYFNYLETLSSQLLFDVFLHLRFGGKLYQLDVFPTKITRRMAKLITELNSGPPKYSMIRRSTELNRFYISLKIAHILSLGAHEVVADVVTDQTGPFVRDFSDFWQRTWIYLALHQEEDKRTVTATIHYILSQKFGIDNRPHDIKRGEMPLLTKPHLELTGRNYKKFKEEVLDWFETYWEPSVELLPDWAKDIPEWSMAMDEKTFYVVPLTNTHELWEEGKAMRNCVGTHAALNKVYNKSVWSMRLLEQGQMKHILTIAVHKGSSIEFEEVRGMANGPIPANARWVLKKWALAHGINIQGFENL
ncbi:MAG: PcfJ domain-containing protein [Bacteroidota bacterium]